MISLIDSSAWISYFENQSNSKIFKSAILKSTKLIVPTIIIYEIYKILLTRYNKETAIQLTAQIKQGQIVHLDERISLLAASISAEKKLGMADSIILATSQIFQATIWTQDQDFEKIPGVEYRKP